MSLAPPRPFAVSFDLKAFDCGKKSLNDWLIKNARRAEERGSARTYLLCDNNKVVGYYCLSNGAVARESNPAAFGGQPRAVPAILLGRLAVHKEYQRKGLGKALALNAFEKAVQVAELSGTVAIFLHVDEQSAFDFWISLGFQTADSGSEFTQGGEQQHRELYLPLQTAKKALELETK